MLDGQVWMNDPNSDDEDERELVVVRLDNGYKLNFFVLGLSEEEYLLRANAIYNLEKSC